MFLLVESGPLIIRSLAWWLGSRGSGQRAVEPAELSRQSAFSPMGHYLWPAPRAPASGRRGEQRVPCAAATAGGQVHEDCVAALSLVAASVRPSFTPDILWRLRRFTCVWTTNLFGVVFHSFAGVLFPAAAQVKRRGRIAGKQRIAVSNCGAVSWFRITRIKVRGGVFANLQFGVHVWGVYKCLGIWTRATDYGWPQEYMRVLFRLPCRRLFSRKNWI